MSERIKVLIVDDSAYMRKYISESIQSDERLNVIGTARNGADALKKVSSLKPDVIMMDIEMPEMDGLETLKQLMEKNPLPVVMFSSLTKKGAIQSVEAMELGAIDFIAKPAAKADLATVREEIVSKIHAASQVNMTHIQKRVVTKSKQIHASIPVQQHQDQKKIVCIGTSTGGPRALQEVLVRFPNTFPAPIMIVQHMPPHFTKTLAARLNMICAIDVKEAEEGELLKKGTAYIAPGGYHLKVKEVGHAVAITLDQVEEPLYGHRPAVDVMFKSISHLKHYQKIAVIMTGMGSDGTNGLKSLKKTGTTYAIAESEASAIVFGMPKSAIQSNLVDDITNVEQIADYILKHF